MKQTKDREIGLPDEGRAAFRSRFLGLDAATPRLVLTPLGFLAERLSEAGPRAPSLWPRREVRGVPIVHGPQGRPIIDGILSLPPGSQVVFVGLAGGLRPPAQVGAWVQVQRAWDGARWHRAGLSPAPGLPQVDAATVGSLTESWEQTEELRAVAHVVDLETSHALEAGMRCGIQVGSVLLVSDEPPACPFWETDLKALTPAAVALPDLLEPWLSGDADHCTPQTGVDSTEGKA